MSTIDPNPKTYAPSNSTESEKLKLYQALILSAICFTFIVLILLYIIRRKCTNVDRSSLGMPPGAFPINFNLSTVELGLSKDIREMLPVVIYKESFTVKDSQCSVCLADYQAEEKLQQMPACGHTFHMECIDRWLTSHTTCPLCRLSLIPKPSLDLSQQTPEIVSPIENFNGGEASAQPDSQSTTEAISHIDDGQEGNRDSQEVSKEPAEENDPNSVGTSDGCRTCRLG
ncbi:RING-H2 finger protein ATL7-like [Arabidopsis lyrata subsp. lyrata]|uniref:RING-H2 finger protein ATL7-like n=1 Tax=Arabidopsis lyrata subsp. lyrata TaxID=81972 RepID=UPI000A29E816|nr:RING-H2 finger protein ATL7-like [Arabidopsis lyrata subsp. lyrata]|eukprot:XP_020879231.1 RING-H2 finger protein ATL7-like [Arabidopsis lyrata subsp. lyrata]